MWRHMSTVLIKEEILEEGGFFKKVNVTFFFQDCKDLIAEFERKLKEDGPKKDAKKKTAAAATSGPTPDKKRKSTADDDRPRGFSRGLDPERIIGATDSSGELMFLIKWKGSDEADLVIIIFFLVAYS